MKRRDFITLLGGAAAWPLAASAQQAMPVVGVVYGVSATDWNPYLGGFHRGLGEFGFIEGRNVAIEYRWAEGRFDRMLALAAANLVDRKVAVLLVGGNTDGAREVTAAIKTTPIVFTSGADPVAAGLVASLNRPGGNVTGATVISGELAPKRLDLLHELIPMAKKVVLLVNSSNRVTSQPDIESTRAAAARLGLEVIVVDGGSMNAIEHAFATAVDQRANALTLGSDAFFNSRRGQIASLSLRHGAADDRRKSTNCRSRHTDELWCRYDRHVPPGRCLCRPHPQGREAWRPTGGPANQVRSGHQSQDRQGAGPTIPPIAARRADEVIE